MSATSKTNTKTKTHTKTNTKTKTKTMRKTKCSKDPSHAIFSKSREFKDIRYDAYRDKDRYKDKDKHKDNDKDNDKDKVLIRPITCYIFEKQGVQGYQIRRLQ